MKILIVTARYFPEQFSITNIAEMLVKMGHEITVLTGTPHYGYGNVIPGYENITYQEINGVKIHRVNEKIRKPGIKGLISNYFSIFKEYNKFLKKHKEKYDAVLSHVISPIFSIRGVNNFCKKNKIPHVHYGLDLWPESLIATSYFKKNSLIYKLMIRYCRNIYRGCDFITFSSPSAENYFSNVLKLPHIPFKHIYQPCLSPVPDIEKINNHTFNKNKINITYCGTIGKFHRIDLFLNAIANSKYRDNFYFHLIGSGSELENIKNLISELNLDNSVSIYGRIPVDETIKHYLNADVLFVPLIENCETSKLIPQKVIEYFMYGKPILGMLKGDGELLIKHASNHNILCDQTVESLIEGLENLYLSKENFALCGRENRHFFDNEKRFSLKIVCKELVDVLSLCINSSKF